MARGRMIATTIALDPEFNAMSAEAQLCFLRAVPHLDRDGLLIGQPAALWATIAPLMPELLPRITGILKEWQSAGLIVVFETKIGPVLYFDGFHKNQAGMRYDREPPSRLPLPPGCERTDEGIRQSAATLPSICRQSAATLPMQVEVEVEVEGEGEGESNETAAPLSSAPPKQPKSPRSSKQKPPQPERPPATEVWRDVFLRYPQKAQYAKFAHITDLEQWRIVCETWRDRGYRPTNISGPLEWYADPSKMERYTNGHHATSKVDQSMREFDEMEQMLDAKGIKLP